jgi:hypothetical protein
VKLTTPAGNDVMAAWRSAFSPIIDKPVNSSVVLLHIRKLPIFILKWRFRLRHQNKTFSTADAGLSRYLGTVTG